MLATWPMAQQRYAEALDELLQAGETGSPLDEAVLYFQGLALLPLNRAQEAVMVLERLVRKVPQNTDYRLDLARA